MKNKSNIITIGVLGAFVGLFSGIFLLSGIANSFFIFFISKYILSPKINYIFPYVIIYIGLLIVPPVFMVIFIIKWATKQRGLANLINLVKKALLWENDITPISRITAIFLIITSVGGAVLFFLNVTTFIDYYKIDSISFFIKLLLQN